jgi:hypothetical protein
MPHWVLYIFIWLEEFLWEKEINAHGGESSIGEPLASAGPVRKNVPRKWNAPLINEPRFISG